MDRIYWLLAVGLVATYLVTTQLVLPGAASSTSTAVVTKVFDGDTVLLDNGEVVRLAGIDTDEKDHPCYQPATRFLEEQVLGEQVRLEAAADNTGKYDRLIRYIFRNGENINIDLVRQGYAVARPGDDATYRQQLLDAQEQASSQNRGCKWSGGGWVAASDSTEEHADNTTATEDICEADQYLNQTVTLRGKIADVHRTESTTYLNFGGRYPDHCFTGVVWSEDRSSFATDLTQLEGRTVELTGYVTRFNGVPEITLRGPKQLRTGS